MKCGCALHAQYFADTDQTTYRIHDENCRMEEAVALVIKLMNRVKYWEAGLGGEDELHSGAEAFLAKVAE